MDPYKAVHAYQCPDPGTLKNHGILTALRGISFMIAVFTFESKVRCNVTNTVHKLVTQHVHVND
jgi:hypothetical protein